MVKSGLAEIENPHRKLYLKELRDILVREYKGKLVSILVFGSVGRGEAKTDSDTDLLVVSDTFPSSMSKRMERLLQILDHVEQTETYQHLKEKGINTWIQFHPLRSEEAIVTRPIYLDMVEDGIILFDKNRFMETILQKLKTKMEQLGSKRYFLEDGSWFWDLKPDLKRGEVIEL